MFDNVLELLVLARPVAPARDDDDDPGGVRGTRRPPRRAEGLLRVPPVPDGGVGRAGRDRLHRRPRDRRDARPQRPPPRPLVRDRGRLGRARLRDGRARGVGGQRRPQGPPAAGQALPRRSRAAPRRPGRRDQAAGCDEAAVRGVGRERDRPPRRPAGAAGARAADGAAPAPPAPVRLRAGGHEDDARAARAQRGGGGRLDGQRHAARGAVAAEAAPLLVLQAAVRAGDEPADRLDPRGRGDEREGERRLGAEPAGRDAGARAAARDRQPDPPRQRARPAAPRPLRRLQGAHGGHDVAGRGRRRRAGDGARPDLPQRRHGARRRARTS